MILAGWPGRLQAGLLAAVADFELIDDEPPDGQLADVERSDRGSLDRETADGERPHGGSTQRKCAACTGADSERAE